MSWFEIMKLPTTDITYIHNGKGVDNEEITEIIIDISLAYIAHLFNRSWLSHYSRACSVIYDSGSEFKLFFENLCESYSLKRKPTTIKNPQANAVL